MQISPIDIRVDIAKQSITFIWSDDTQQIFNHQQLREACACAFCKTKRFVDQPVTTDANVTIIAMYDQGYGAQICFSDGHDKGIYPWQFIKELHHFSH